MSESLPATAVANESARASNKPSAAIARVASLEIAVALVETPVAFVEMFPAFVEMSESLPATAVAKESARSSNKPSAAKARASSAFTSATRSRIS